MSTDHWTLLDPSSVKTLRESRLLLHWAAQLPSAAGATLLEARADYSHTSLSWSSRARALVTLPLPDGRRAGLRLHDLSLTIVEADGRGGALCRLAGRTLAQGLTWLEEQTGSSAPLVRPAHDLPSHPVEEGASFAEADPASLRELERWFANAELALREVVLAWPEAAELRVWPHHFDIATLLAVPSKTDTTRTIGIGMSPGDGSYDEPYFYVTPWPYPVEAVLPRLGGGADWNTEGWVGAVLLGSRLEAEGQREQVSSFLGRATEACLELHARADPEAG